LFLACGASLGARTLPPRQDAAYAFAVAEYDVDVTVSYYDRYSASGLSFRDLSHGRHFCLNAAGEQDRDCAAGFAGSLAIARYRFQPRSPAGPIPAALREHVRTIDHDARLRYRSPFDRTIELRDGVASDIQAFGYETSPPPAALQPASPWYYFRQDLFLEGSPSAFLIVHWRHTFNAIRILDVIPGDGTWPVRQTR